MTPHPWEKNYPPMVSWRARLPPPIAIEEFLERTQLKWPDKVAIDFYGRQLTFAELRSLAARAARGLEKLGVGPGVKVGLHLPNTPHFVICFFAVLMAGGCVVSLNTLSGLEELKYQVRDSDTKVLITGDWLAACPDLANARGTKFDTVVVCSLTDFVTTEVAAALASSDRSGWRRGDEVDFAALIANEALARGRARDSLDKELAVLQYTGGTTGDPKAAMLTHANFCAVMRIEDRWTGAANQTTKILCVLPLSHIYSLLVMLRAVYSGLQLILHMRFEAERVLTDIAGKQVNVFAGVPAMFSGLLTHGTFDKADLSSLTSSKSGGAPLPVEIRRKFEQRTGRAMLDGYGLTEVTGCVTVSTPDSAREKGDVGLPAPCTIVEVVDLETGLVLLPIGEVGEICVTGPQVMRGYWQRPEATAEAFRGGRFHTGDIGCVLADGRVRLMERKKDVIITGGHNVFPQTIERAIYEHPAVAEVAVIGIPDSDFGEVAKALVVLKPGGVRFSYDELCTFLASRVSSFEIPMELEIRDALPKTSAGKLSKKDLLAEQRALASTRRAG
jgi:long-chain acyl-CoA synthetase